MKCLYCGKEIIEGAKFCDGCGKKVEQPVVQQPVQQPVYAYPPKRGKGLVVTVIIMSIIILAGIIFGVWYFVIRDDDKNTASNNQANIVNTNTNTNINLNTNTNTNTGKNNSFGVNTGTKVDFLDYELTVPSGYKHKSLQGKTYLESSECIILYMEYMVSVDLLNENLDAFIEELGNSGVTITSTENKTYYGEKYIIMKGKMSGVEIAYMYVDLKGEDPVLVTITSQNLNGKIEDKWIRDAAEFLGSAE